MVNFFDILRTFYMITVLYPKLIFDEIKNEMNYPSRFF
jgi:hypothetical protein